MIDATVIALFFTPGKMRTCNSHRKNAGNYIQRRQIGETATPRSAQNGQRGRREHL